jgi:hypothetical protein
VATRRTAKRGKLTNFRPKAKLCKSEQSRLYAQLNLVFRWRGNGETVQPGLEPVIAFPRHSEVLVPELAIRLRRELESRMVIMTSTKKEHYEMRCENG